MERLVYNWLQVVEELIYVIRRPQFEKFREFISNIARVIVTDLNFIIIDNPIDNN